MSIDRYLKITRWATERYRKNSKLILWVGNNPSTWTRIEHLAFKKYINGK